MGSMNDIDQERYTTAMMALGFARGLISRMKDMLLSSKAAALREDIAWLDARIGRVMHLNDIAQPPGGKRGQQPEE